MTPAPHHTPRIGLAGAPLLLGDGPAPGVDVVVLDLHGVPAEEVAALVADAEAHHSGGVGVFNGVPSAVGAAVRSGVGLVVLDVATTDPAEVRAVAQAGVVLVLHHTEPAAAVGAVDGLCAAGIDTSRVVVEVGPGPDLVEQVTVLDRTAYGFRVGAVVGLPDAGGSWSPARRDGWEIGTVTAILSAGVATVRGVAPERFRRIAATLHAVDAAVAPEVPDRIGPGPEVRPGGATGAPSPPTGTVSA